MTTDLDKYSQLASELRQRENDRLVGKTVPRTDLYEAADAIDALVKSLAALQGSKRPH